MPRIDGEIREDKLRTSTESFPSEMPESVAHRLLPHLPTGRWGNSQQPSLASDLHDDGLG